MTQCQIHNIAFGGEGVGRKDNFVLFVPFTLPEEVVEVEILQKKQNFAKAKLKQIIEKNPNRVDPPCPYFSTCGGCQLQHASYSLQLEIKKRFVEDSLLRIGNISLSIPSVIPSPTPFSYRRHISLKIRPVQGSLKLGFTAVDGISHVPIKSCLLFHPPGDSILLHLQSALKELNSNLILEASFKLFKTSNQTYLLTCHFPLTLSQKDLKLFTAKLPHSLLSGWILKMPGQVVESGDIEPSFSYREMTFYYSPFGFIQNHPEQSANIYDWILQSMDSSEKILDLYCGIGVSTLSLAHKNKNVIGIELNPASIEFAKKNKDKNGILKAQFLCGPAEILTPEVIRDFCPDSVVVNPPKTGIDSRVLESLCNSSIHTLIYISCSPPTLARDLKILVNQGFILETLQSFDMFPQTTHVETIVKLSR